MIDGVDFIVCANPFPDFGLANRSADNLDAVCLHVLTVASGPVGGSLAAPEDGDRGMGEDASRRRWNRDRASPQASLQQTVEGCRRQDHMV